MKKKIVNLLWQQLHRSNVNGLTYNKKCTQIRAAD